MRIVLEEMKDDPDPVVAGSQGTVEGRDDVNDVLMSWDTGSSLKLLDIDKYHVISSEDEIQTSFENLRIHQKKGYNICPRCGKTFDVRRGAVSRRIKKLNISICDLCGQQEAIEDFFAYEQKRDIDSIESFSDWYIVKVWKGAES